MDTKSKKLSDSFAAKCIAFILCVVLSTFAFVSVYYFANKANELEYRGNFWDVAKSNSSFVDSDGFENIFAGTTYQISSVFESYLTANDAKDPMASEQYEIAFQSIWSAFSDLTVQGYVYDGFDGEISAESGDTDISVETGLPSEGANEAKASAGAIGPKDADKQNRPEVPKRPPLPKPINFENAKILYTIDFIDIVDSVLGEHHADAIIFDPSLISSNSALFRQITEGAGGMYIYFKSYDDPDARAEFERIYAAELADVKAKILEYAKENYEMQREDLSDMASAYGINYFITNGEFQLANVPLSSANLPQSMAVFNDSPANFSMLNEQMSSNLTNMRLRIENVNFRNPENVRMYFSFDDKFIDEQNEALANLRKEILTMGIIVGISMLFVLVLLVWLIIVCGRTREDGTRKLYKLDAIPAEIQLIICFMLLFVPTIIMPYGIGFIENLGNAGFVWEYFLLACAALVILTVLLWVLLSIIRNIKAGLLIKRSLIYKIGKLLVSACKKIGVLIKTGFDKRNPMAKTIILVVALFLIAVLGGMLFFICAMNGAGVLAGLVLIAGVALFVLSLLYTFRFVTKYANFKKGIEEIVSGNVTYEIPVDESSTSEFDVMSMKVNKIGSAINTAVQNELKKELMKTELISNVSHDLKTPLTSIITYTDLLKTEGLRSKNAKEYLDIIDEKGKQLNQLTEDLFSAAKAASGEITVNKEKVDLLALINQEIVELNGKLTDKDLDMQIVTKEENYFIYADSQLIWRVVDNLLTNVSKYALPGSRVYIELSEEEVGGEYASRITTMQIKNISAMQLNIPAEELMERFKRGDESRTTSGSGLGLAIAKDLIRIMDGQFDIHIDGDLFKVTVQMQTFGNQVR